MKKDQSAQFEHHMEQAKKLHDSQPHNFHEIVGKHKEHLSTYINKTVRDDTKPTTKGLRAHISDRMSKEVDKVSTEKAKASKRAAHMEALLHHDENEHHFANALKIHHHIQAAKDILVNGLNQKKHGDMEHHIDGKETNPEGYVARHNGESIKLVNRAEFSKANFAAPKEWKK